MTEQWTLESGSRITSSTYIWLEEMTSTPSNIYPSSLKDRPDIGLKAFLKTQLEVGRSSRTLSEQIFKGPMSALRMQTISVTLLNSPESQLDNSGTDFLLKRIR